MTTRHLPFFRTVTATVCTLAAAISMRAASVTVAGYTNDFATQPLASDFSTRPIGSGGFNAANEFQTPTQLDAGVQTNSAALITARPASATGTPPAAAGNAVWASAGGYLQTRSTQNGATLLMATLVNDAGGDATGALISYDYITNRASTGAEQIPGHRVYYSLSGLPSTWVNIPQLSQTAQGTLLAELTFAAPWTNGGRLYLIWADDNGSVSPDDALNIDNFFVAATGTAASSTLVAPSSGQSFPDTNAITLRANANPGPGATVTGVGFYETTAGLLGSAFSAPYTVDVPLAPAVYSVYAVSTNSLGTVVFSATNTFTVTNVPFSIALLSPTNNTTHGTPTNVVLSAAGYAGDGASFTGVGFYDVTHGHIISVGSAPFDATVYFTGGTFQIYAVATNSQQAIVTSRTNTLVVIVPPTNTVAPRIHAQTPLHSTPVTYLTNINVVFTEAVAGVDASDLLVNGVPATGVTGGGSNYTFHFPQPPYGQPVITWAVDHGIIDFGWPSSLAFDAQGDGATWGYYLIDQTAPTIALRTPAANASVTNLTEISVTFSEAVTGVDASDLLVNGTAATDVTGDGSNFLFSVVQPPSFGPLTINVTWSTNHGITDMATTPNAFNRATGGWNFTLDVRTILIQSNSLWRFVKGTQEASVPGTAWRQPGFDASSWSNAPAPFFFGDPYSNGVPAYTWLHDMQSNYSTIYLLKEFTVANPAAITNVLLNLQVDDGAVVWLNGVEVRRLNAPAGEVPYNGVATGTTQEPQNAGAGYTSYPLTNGAAAALVPGVNVLAIHALNQSLTASSDFGFNAQLYTYVADNSSVAPRILVANPAPGEVQVFNSVEIRFSEPVTGVQAGDLLINGSPALAVSSTDAETFTFTFTEPSTGPAVLTFAEGHGIADLDTPPKPFNAAAPSATLQYWRVDAAAPVIATTSPAAAATVNTLTSVTVTFSESVSGVNAADLLINGSPASNVSGSGTTYTFSFPQPAYGVVSFSWAASTGIQDLDANLFDGTRTTNRWNVTFIDQVAPAIASQNPVAGSFVPELTSMSVTFTEPVSGVNASDVLLNGLPATGVSGSGTSYTFTFPQPNASVVNVTWAANHGISDIAVTPNSFNAATAGATWTYSTLDTVAPSIAVDPPPQAIVKNLTRISIEFDEPVTGVQASDLLINGAPAQGLTGSGAGPYSFTFTRPPTGSVQLAFAPGHDIRDLANPANTFPGATWSYTLNPAIPTAIAVRYVVQISIDGLAAKYLSFYVTNAPAEYPNFNRLISQSAHTMNARCDYDVSETIPNHTSMFTGRPVLQPAGLPNTTHHGYNNNFPAANDTVHTHGNPNVPYKFSMFDVAHDYGLTTAFYAGKTRLDFCDRSYNAVNGAADLIGEDNGTDKIDFSNVIDIQGNAISNQVNTILADLNSTDPHRYIFIHIAEPDLTGHSTSWGSSAYSNIVRFIDTQLGRIMDAIDANPAMANQTALIVSTDHGGGGGQANSHLLASHPDNYTIPFFIRAPSITPGSDAYDLFANRANPGTNWTDYTSQPQPIRNADGSNLALSLLAMPPIPGSYMMPVWATPSVTLRMARFGGQLSVFWGDPNDEYELQAASILAPNQWQTVTSGITVIETTKVYTVNDLNNAEKQFFRLRKK